MNLDASAFVADQELIRALSHRSTPVDCAQDRVLFQQGEEPTGVFILRQGGVTMSMCDEFGDAVVELTAEPGSLLGLPGVVGNCPYSLSAKALAGALVDFVACDDFRTFMLTEPGGAMMILRVLAAEVRTARVAACKG